MTLPCISLLRRLLAALLLCASGLLLAMPVLLSPQAPPQLLRQFAEYYAGPELGHDLQQLPTAQVHYRPLAGKPPSLGRSSHWVRLKLHNISTTAGQWVLNLGVPDIEHLDAYLVQGEKTVQLTQLTPDSPYSARPLPERMLALPIQLAGQSQAQLYLHYSIHGDTPLRLEMMTLPQFQQQLAKGELFNGLLIGILLTLLIFAALQYFAFNRPAYRYYALVLIFVVLFQCQIEGYTFQWLWPDWGRFNQYAPPLLVGCIHVAHLLFTCELFDLRQQMPWLYRAYQLFGWLMALCAVSFVVTLQMTPIIVVSLLFMPLPLITGVAALRQGLPAAGYFLAGAGSLALSMNVLFSLSVAGVGVLSDVSPFVFPKIGYLLEAVFFTAALGQQLRMLHLRHEAALQHRLAEAEQLAQSEADKHRALQATQQLQLQLAAAGHDLSQPLSSIRFALASLRNQSGSEATTRHIDKALDYTESLLNTLIADAKGGFAKRQQLLNVEDLLVDVQQRHLATAHGKGLALRYFPSRARISGSEVILGRVLDNLVVNALRYTERGKVLLGVRRRADGLEIQVLDSGPGIAAHLLPRLQQPFEQSGQHANERLGHGLGLHIVKALCAESGYRLTIRSSKGCGSCFGVLIPYESDE